MTEIAAVMAIVGIMTGAGYRLYRKFKRYTCPNCGVPVPGRGYCSRDCSVKDRARKLLAKLDDPNPN